MFGDRLRKRREELGLSRNELAGRLGIKPRALGFYETNDREPSFDIVCKLADVLDCSVDYLFGRTDKPNAMVLTNKELDKYLQDELKEKKIKVEVEKTEISEDMLKKIADIVYMKFVEKMIK